MINIRFLFYFSEGFIESTITCANGNVNGGIRPPEHRITQTFSSVKIFLLFWFVFVRFYTFGIGPEACPNLVQGVAGAGRGQAHFIADDERMPVKVCSPPTSLLG